ncbi:MAG: 30S ribosomal protein S8e [Nanohaloarchaea archaeon SW_7_43_1]|nr:MAG: 30S ribosomal protein S8e [Nanohaloarchaea archaeon SW_7_43_1]
MAILHRQSGRKKTGGRKRRNRKPKKHEMGSEFSAPEKGEKKVEKRKTRGGNQKNVVKRAEKINLATDGEVENVEIESVEDNPANPNYVRRSLLTKGTVVQTSEGKARVTSRPGQEGVINGELVDE